MRTVPESGYRAARASSARTEVGLGALSLSGPDRRKFLHGLVTADILALEPGGWTPAYLLTPKGRLVTELAVYDRGQDLLLLVRGPASRRLLEAALGKSIILSESKLEPLDGRATLCAGPAADERWRDVTGCAEAGAGGWVCRSRFWGPCWLVFGGGEAAATPVHPSVFEALRVEAGVAAEGDLDEETFPLELGEAGISFEKGCYLGQETTAKMKHLGHANRRLSRLRLEGPVEDGAELTVDGQRVGRATSVVDVPGKGVLALALLRLAAASPGTRLVAAGGVRTEVL